MLKLATAPLKKCNPISSLCKYKWFNRSLCPFPNKRSM